MKKIVKEALPITRFTKSREDAIAYFKEKDEPYKVELIEDPSGGFGNQLLPAGGVCGSVRRPPSDEHQAGESL